MTGPGQRSSPHDLALTEALALLALSEDTGRPIVGSNQLKLGLAGAILAELAVSGRIEMVDNRLQLSSPEPLGDPVCDQAVLLFAQEAKNRRPDWWVRKLSTPNLRSDVFDQLVGRGVVSDRGSRILGIFPVVRLSLDRPQTASGLREGVQLALAGGVVGARTAALAGLAAGTGLLRKLFPEADRKSVKMLLANQWAGKAVKAVLDSSAAAAA